MNRSRCASLAIAGVLAGALITGPAAQSASAVDEGPFPVPNSNTLSGSAVYTANLSGGAIGAPESTVVAQAWPNNTTLASMPEGTEFETTIISYGTRYGNGSVELKIAPTVDLTAYTNEDGTMNVSVYAYVGGDLRLSRGRTMLASQTSTADVAAYTAAQTSAEPSTTETVSEPTTSGGGGGTTLPTNTSTQNLIAPTGGESASAQDAAAATATATAPDDLDISGSSASGADSAAASICGLRGNYKRTLLKTGSPAAAIVGQTFSNTSASLARWTYKRGQSSTVGVAVGVTIGAITANMGYTNVSADNATIGYPDKIGTHAWFYTTNYRSNLYQQYCLQGGVKRKISYEVRPVSHYGGGTYYSTGNKPHATSCSLYRKGTFQDLDRSKAITWSNGLKVSGLGVEVSLSAQTGYTSNAVVYYKANAGNIYLCGKGGGPAEDTASILAASKTAAGW